MTLRAFREDEFDELLELRKKLAAVQPTAAGSDAREWLKKRVENSGRLVDGWLDFAIEAGGRLVGDVDARQPVSAMPQGVFELGIGLFDTGDRGRGYGSEAVRLLTDHLFDAYDAHRVQAGTWVENHAMRRVFEKLGYRCEGIMRAFMPTAGGRDDYALYAITREDWTKLGP